MPSVVNGNCKFCKSCVEVCPVDAFKEGDNRVVVDPDICIDCGACIAECPEAAISSSDEAEEKWIQFNAEKAKEWPVADK